MLCAVNETLELDVALVDAEEEEILSDRRRQAERPHTGVAAEPHVVPHELRLPGNLLHRGLNHVHQIVSRVRVSDAMVCQ